MARLISIAELAARTSTCENFWRKKIARGEVPVVRIGRSVRVDEEIVKLIVTCGVRSKANTPKETFARITEAARVL